MKYEKKIVGAIKSTFRGLFEDKEKMDFILSQGGFEKYLQFELAEQLRKSELEVGVEAVDRIDVMIRDKSKNLVAIEMGAGFLSQSHQKYKPGKDWRKFSEKVKKNSSLKDIDYYALMMLAYQNDPDKIPDRWKKQYKLINFNPVMEEGWNNLGFMSVFSEQYCGKGLGLSVVLLNPGDK